MEINVLNNNFEKIAIVDQYRSLIWSKRYYDIGALDLEIEASIETLSIFKKGYYITRGDDDAIYVIKALEVDTQEDGDNYLIIGAYDCKEILQRRIVWNTVVFTGTAENYIRKLITDNVINPTATNRKINNFNLKAAKGFTETIDQQVTYDNLADKIIEVCTTFGYGWKVTRENGQFYFDLYKGVDRSINQDVTPRIVFSPENENIISTKYKTDDSDFKNVALVGGEGEGVDRKKRTIGNAEGLDRYETFIDASGLSSNTEEGDLVDYYNALIAEGKEKLSEQAVTTSFEGEVDTNSYKYKTDYNLGDLVTVKNEYGITSNARITEVIETWDDEGYTVEPKFEYFEPIDFEVPVEGALLTENRVMLLSETGGVPLTSENATNGIKISELDPVNELFDGCCFPIVQNGVTKKVTKATLESEITEGIQTELNKKLDKSGGAMTGNISYKGTKNTFEMIKFINNTVNEWGNGIAIGGGGATIIGGGESSDVLKSSLSSGGDEVMKIGNDQNVEVWTNLQSGNLSNGKKFDFKTDGNITTPKGTVAVTSDIYYEDYTFTNPTWAGVGNIYYKGGLKQWTGDIRFKVISAQVVYWTGFYPWVIFDHASSGSTQLTLGLFSANNAQGSCIVRVWYKK